MLSVWVGVEGAPEGGHGWVWAWDRCGERKGRKGLLPRAGQAPQLGEQVCQLMSALPAEGRGAGEGWGSPLAGWPANFWGLFIAFISATLYLILLSPLTLLHPPEHTLGA